MENLNEVNLYLPATCELECPACTSYFHQINHCTVHSGDGLKTDDYRRLIRQFLMNGIKRINIFAGGNPNKIAMLGNCFLTWKIKGRCAFVFG